MAEEKQATAPEDTSGSRACLTGEASIPFACPVRDSDVKQAPILPKPGFWTATCTSAKVALHLYFEPLRRYKVSRRTATHPSH